MPSPDLRASVVFEACQVNLNRRLSFAMTTLQELHFPLILDVYILAPLSTGHRVGRSLYQGGHHVMAWQTFALGRHRLELTNHAYEALYIATPYGWQLHFTAVAAYSSPAADPVLPLLWNWFTALHDHYHGEMSTFTSFLQAVMVQSASNCRTMLSRNGLLRFLYDTYFLPLVLHHRYFVFPYYRVIIPVTAIDHDPYDHRNGFPLFEHYYLPRVNLSVPAQVVETVTIAAQVAMMATPIATPLIFNNLTLKAAREFDALSDDPMFELWQAQMSSICVAIAVTALTRAQRTSLAVRLALLDCNIPYT